MPPRPHEGVHSKLALTGEPSGRMFPIDPNVRKCYILSAMASRSRRPKEERPPPLTPAQATAAIRRVFLEGGPFSRTEHFWRELTKANADMGDVNHVLERGAVSRPGQWKPEHRAYNYDMGGTDLEGEELHVVVCIDEENFRLILITAY